MLVTEKNASGCLERVERSDSLVLDTETTGLGAWTGDKVCGVAINGMYFPFRHGEGENLSDQRRRQLVKAASGKPVRGFHLRFDLEMMHNEGLPLPPKIEDTLIAALLMNENEPSFALKRSKNGIPGLSLRYLGTDAAWAEDVMQQKLEARGFKKDDLWRMPASEVADYACGDLILPDRLMAEVYRTSLDRWGMTGIFAEYNEYQRLLIEMEIGGLPVDRTVVDRALLDGEQAREALLAELKQAAGYPLNPNSWNQVSAFCGTPNAQEETLLHSNHPNARMILDFKAYTKRDSTYLQRFIDFSDPRGMLHCQLNLTNNEEGVGGTRSARLSCSRPNLQAMPKPKTNIIYAPCRQAIAAPPGFGIVEADYSQAEVRIAGHYSQEPALFRAFAEKRDLYAEMSAALRITRMEAKILFLAIQYGAGAWKIATMLGISETEAYDLRTAWHNLYPRIKRMMYRLSDIAEENHCIKLWTGRWGHFDGETKSVHCKSPYYTAWNRLIQGSVGEMVRIAMMRLWEPIRLLGGRMLLQIHDSILFLVPIERMAEATVLIRRTMQDFPLWDIPPVVDIKAGPNWLDVQEVKEAA